MSSTGSHLSSSTHRRASASRRSSSFPFVRLCLQIALVTSTAVKHETIISGSAASRAAIVSVGSSRDKSGTMDDAPRTSPALFALCEQRLEHAFRKLRTLALEEIVRQWLGGARRA